MAAHLKVAVASQVRARMVANKNVRSTEEDNKGAWYKESLMYIVLVFAIFVLAGHLILSSARKRNVMLQMPLFDEDEHCYFLQGDERPTPFIYFSAGKSGSSAVWTILSNLTGGENNAREWIGGNNAEMKEFYENVLVGPNESYDWITQHLCRLQHEYNPTSGIVGFKWKPYTQMDHKYTTMGLRLAQLQDTPRIRAVYLRRNILDRIASTRKRLVMIKETGHVSGHCRKSFDEEKFKRCMEEVKKYEQSIALPTGKELIKLVRTEDNQYSKVVSLLDSIGIEHMDLSYGKLFDANNTDEWIRAFKFLGKGPTENLSMEEVQEAAGQVRTNFVPRSERITNFQDVVATLEGTEYAHYLYDE